jgi:hypothetical protein
VKVDARAHDTFLNSQDAFGTYDIALTNPPWEALKPDRRELDQMDADSRDAFHKSLRHYDSPVKREEIIRDIHGLEAELAALEEQHGLLSTEFYRFLSGRRIGADTRFRPLGRVL